MAGSFNRIVIVGNVGRDPESRTTSTGDAVADFSVATTDRRRGPDGQTQEQTTWFRVAAFGKLAETCQQYLRKGSYVYVEGALSQREYTDRDGNQRQSLDVRARDMRMLDRKEDRDDTGPALVGAGAGAGDVNDLPF